jgi:hypothetical protein
MLSETTHDIDDASTSSDGASCEMHLFVGAFMQEKKGGEPPSIFHNFHSSDFLSKK